MHVFLIAAITQDGFIARHQSETSTHWTSPEDFAFFTQRTKQAGIVVMGSTTYRTINHPLKGRLTIVLTSHPESIPDAQDITQIPNYQTTSTSPLFTTSLSPQDLVQLLSVKMYPELAICGGSSIYTLFMKTGLVDTVYLTVHTQVTFGSGIRLFNEAIHLPDPIATTPLSSTTILQEYKLK